MEYVDTNLTSVLNNKRNSRAMHTDGTVAYRNIYIRAIRNSPADKNVKFQVFMPLTLQSLSYNPSQGWGYGYYLYLTISKIINNIKHASNQKCIWDSEGRIAQYGGVTLSNDDLTFTCEVPNSGSTTISFDYYCNCHTYSSSVYCTDEEVRGQGKHSVSVTVNVPDYDPYTPPSKINDLKINNKSSVGLDHLSDALNLTWSVPSAGSDPIEGYRIDYKINNGSYTLFTNTENNYYNTSLQPFEELINRGDIITFRVRAYNSGGAGEYSNTVTCTFNIIVLELSVNPIGINMAKINWTCTENCSQIEYKLGTANYKVASTGLNTASGSFNIPNLTYKTNYTVQVAAVLKASGQRVYATINFTTLDIARIINVPLTWNVEEPATIKVKLPETSGVNYSFSVSYNNIDIISRPNISIINNEYILNLTQEEKSFIYGITETDANPSVKFNLKTYVSQLVGTDSKTIPLTFNTKAWVKVSNSWKRAFVWIRVNGVWQISNPWVKVGNTWKKI